MDFESINNLSEEKLNEIYNNLSNNSFLYDNEIAAYWCPKIYCSSGGNNCFYNSYNCSPIPHYGPTAGYTTTNCGTDFVICYY